MGLDLGFMDIIGGISTIVGNVGAREQALERANTQLQGGYAQVGTAGGTGVPQGGFRLTGGVRSWITEHNRNIGPSDNILENIFQGVGQFFSGERTTPIADRVQTVDQARALVDEIRRDNPALADELVRDLNAQLGGTQTTFGALDIKESLLDDFGRQTLAAEEDWERQQRGAELLGGIGADVDAARGHLNIGLDKVIADSKRAEEAAVRSLDIAKIGSLMQLADSMKLRREVMASFQDNTAIAMEVQRSALSFMHRNDEDALRNRLANDPAFANRPDAIEAQMRDLQDHQKNQIVQAAGGIKIQYDQMRSQLDMSTAQLEAQAAMAMAGDTVSIAGMESGIKVHFADTVRDAELNRTQNNVALDLLERDGKVQLANYLRDMTQTIVPYAPVLQMAMGLDIAIEDRANALRWGSEAEANAFWGNLGETLFGLGAIDRQEEAAKASRKSQRQSTELGWAGFGTDILGAIMGGKGGGGGKK